MSHHLPLQQLRRLDRSSSEFGDELNNIICGEEYQECVPNLQDDDLVWLVDYLDMVRRCITLTLSSLTLA
jgi:hypothetical protein